MANVNIKFNNNEILDASHSVAAGLIQNEININNKNRSKYTFRDDKGNLKKKIKFNTRVISTVFKNDKFELSYQDKVNNEILKDNFDFVSMESFCF